MAYVTEETVEKLIGVINTMSNTQRNLTQIAENHSKRIAELESFIAAQDLKDQR